MAPDTNYPDRDPRDETIATLRPQLAAAKEKLLAAQTAVRLLDAEADDAVTRITTAEAERDRAVGLLSEVAECFTRDDDLPNELLPRISAAIAAGGEGDRDG